MNRTRVVQWLRVLFPLAALAMLSTLFLFQGGGDTASRIPYARVDAPAMDRKPRLVAPGYAGLTNDGARLSLSAADAVPLLGGGRAAGVELVWERPDGMRATLSAPQGAIVDGTIRLAGGVQVETSTGWRLDAATVEAATDRSLIGARGGIKARAPFGSLSADALRIDPDPGRDASILNLSGNVRLIYQP